MRYSFKDSDFLILKRAHDALVREWEVVKREFYARKFDPSQPRVPAGGPGGGQWRNDGGTTVPATIAPTASAPETTASGTASVDDIKVAMAPSESFCWNQMQIDFLLCDSLRSVSRIMPCRSQAMERYAACLRGKPLPPLPY
jgi:hypothetical protein